MGRLGRRVRPRVVPALGRHLVHRAPDRHGDHDRGDGARAARGGRRCPGGLCDLPGHRRGARGHRPAVRGRRHRRARPLGARLGAARPTGGDGIRGSRQRGGDRREHAGGAGRAGRPAGARAGRVGLDHRRPQHPPARSVDLDRRTGHPDGGAGGARRVAGRPALGRAGRHRRHAEQGRARGDPAHGPCAGRRGRGVPHHGATGAAGRRQWARGQERHHHDPDARVPRRDDALRPSGGRGSADPRAHRGCRAGRAARRRLPHARRPDTDHRRRAVPRRRRCHGHAGAGEGRRADVDGHRHAHPAAHRHRHLRLDGPAGVRGRGLAHRGREPGRHGRHPAARRPQLGRAVDLLDAPARRPRLDPAAAGGTAGRRRPASQAGVLAGNAGHEARW